MTDPIGAMLIMIKNASLASKDSITVPYSKLKHAIATCLEKDGYVTSVAQRTKGGHQVLEIGIAYKDEAPMVTHVERVSKPSRRVYMGVADIKAVRNGHGRLVLSTPKGIMNNTEARKQLVGGEALFKIW
jgi:small subunit ribosomal protein S8